KTILTLQMLFHAARAGRRAVYFTTLSEPALKIIRYMQAFEYFDAALLDEHIRFVDVGGRIRGGAGAILSELVGRVEQHEPALVAVDSFRAIGDLLGDPATVRSFVYDLANEMAGWGATTL